MLHGFLFMLESDMLSVCWSPGTNLRLTKSIDTFSLTRRTSMISEQLTIVYPNRRKDTILGGNKNCQTKLSGSRSYLAGNRSY